MTAKTHHFPPTLFGNVLNLPYLSISKVILCCASLQNKSLVSVLKVLPWLSHVSSLAVISYPFLLNISGVLKRGYPHRLGNVAKSGTDTDINEQS